MKLILVQSDIVDDSASFKDNIGIDVSVAELVQIPPVLTRKTMRKFASLK